MMKLLTKWIPRRGCASDLRHQLDAATLSLSGAAASAACRHCGREMVRLNGHWV